ncbi:MAG: hypothetical protein RL641_17 [Candidatus Parcubacteria bacterium]|jgi:MFS family permease
MRIVKVRALRFALITGFLFSLHIALVSYANSTFAANLFGEDAVGPLFSIAAFISLLALLFWAPKKIARNGSLLFVALLMLVSIFTLTGLTQATFSIVSALFFIIYLSSNTIIFYGLDMMVEHATKNSDTGKIRGIYLTVLSLAWMLALLGTGAIIERGGFNLLYFVGAVLVFFSLLAVYKGGASLNTRQIGKVQTMTAIKQVLQDKNLSAIYLVNFMLQVFYVVMVIFTPLYLTTVIGFSWKEVGMIFFIMLSPFVFLQYPLGRIADKRFGEKEIMIFGLLILGLATLMIFNMESSSIWIWATVLFATRVGAATVEVMSESYFFKHVNENDTGLIGIYRALAPLAYVIVPMLASWVISNYNYGILYSALGILCLMTIIPASRIKDTR